MMREDNNNNNVRRRLSSSSASSVSSLLVVSSNNNNNNYNNNKNFNNDNNYNDNNIQQKQKRKRRNQQHAAATKKKSSSFSIIKLGIIGLVLGLTCILIITTTNFYSHDSSSSLLFLFGVGDNNSATVTVKKTKIKTESIGQKKQKQHTTHNDDVNDNNDNNDNDVKNDHNNDNDDNNKYEDNDDDFHTNIWPLLKSHLCPKPFQPNKDLATLVLFPLAAQQVFLSSENNNSNNNNNNNNNNNIIDENIINEDEDEDELMMMIPKPTRTKYGSGILASKFYYGFYAKNVLVYDPTSKSTITYLPIWKCANNQIREYLQSTYQQIEYTDLTKLIYNKTIDFSSSSTSSSKSCVITVLRDPIEHFLSGYNEIEYRMMFGDDFHLGLSEKFNNKIDNTADYYYNKNNNNNKWMLHGKPQNHLTQELGSTARFEYFVKEILGKNSSQLTHYYISHIFSMSRILSSIMESTHPNNKQPITAYLPTLSNLTYNFPSFVNRNCGTGTSTRTTTGSSSSKTTTTKTTTTISPMEIMGQHNSSKDILGTYEAAKKVWNLQGPVAKALCIIHVIDYACWPKLHIPEFCKNNVYKEQHFIQTITNTTYYYRKQLEDIMSNPNNQNNRQYTIQGKKWPLPIPSQQP